MNSAQYKCLLTSHWNGSQTSDVCAPSPENEFRAVKAIPSAIGLRGREMS
ncbi:hypothetical protein GCM10020370_45110 [Paenibacillus hodogayensis]